MLSKSFWAYSLTLAYECQSSLAIGCHSSHYHTTYHNESKISHSFGVELRLQSPKSMKMHVELDFVSGDTKKNVQFIVNDHIIAVFVQRFSFDS